MWEQLVPFVLVAGIFYLLLLRPEQRRRKQLDAEIGALKRNDAVVVAGGLHGRVVTLGEKIVAVEIAPKIVVQVDREAIQRVLTATPADAREKEKEKS